MHTLYGRAMHAACLKPPASPAAPAGGRGAPSGPAGCRGGGGESDARWPWGWRASLVRQEKRSRGEVGFASLTLSFLTISPPLLVMTIVDKVLTHHSYSTLALLGAILAIAATYEVFL